MPWGVGGGCGSTKISHDLITDLILPGEMSESWHLRIALPLRNFLSFSKISVLKLFHDFSTSFAVLHM